MAADLFIAKSAASEICSIAQYLSEEFSSPAAARSFIEEFNRQAELACLFPESHPLCAHAELAQRGYRAFRVGRYIAIYTTAPGQLRVLHVFHQSQDYADDALA